MRIWGHLFSNDVCTQSNNISQCNIDRHAPRSAVDHWYGLYMHHGITGHPGNAVPKILHGSSLAVLTYFKKKKCVGGFRIHAPYPIVAILKEVGHTFVVMVCILPIFNSYMVSFWDCYF